jgi:predicted enzyme related to lactoylglutathione lyase
VVNECSRKNKLCRAACGWSFTDYGAEYTAFSDAGLEGGFYRAPFKARAENGSALVVLYSDNLVETRNQVVVAGGIILKEFPGRRRFHFAEPSGNEFGVWSEPACAIPI